MPICSTSMRCCQVVAAWATATARWSLLVAVAEGRFDAGLIIHEGQLTFQNQGLRLIVDLGVWWQERSGLPLPLGGNVVRRDLGPDVIRRISRLLKESIRYGLAHRDEALAYALGYARD